MIQVKQVRSSRRLILVCCVILPSSRRLLGGFTKFDMVAKVSLEGLLSQGYEVICGWVSVFRTFEVAKHTNQLK